MKSVASSRFVASVLAVTRDTIQRMENIGREDAVCCRALFAAFNYICRNLLFALRTCL